VISALLLAGCLGGADPATDPSRPGRAVGLLPTELGNRTVDSREAAVLARSACREFEAASRPPPLAAGVPLRVNQHLARADGYALLAAQGDPTWQPLSSRISAFIDQATVFRGAVGVTIMNRPAEVEALTAGPSGAAEVLQACRAR
jgi:hypothetical protein